MLLKRLAPFVNPIIKHRKPSAFKVPTRLVDEAAFHAVVTARKIKATSGILGFINKLQGFTNTGFNNRGIRFTKSLVLKSLHSRGAIKSYKIAQEINAAFPNNPPIVRHILPIRIPASHKTHPLRHILGPGEHLLMERAPGDSLENLVSKGIISDAERDHILENQVWQLSKQIRQRAKYRLTDLHQGNVFYDVNTGEIKIIDIDEYYAHKIP